VFPRSQHVIVSHSVLGVSLGGHAAWHCILHESRIHAAVIVVGCPDYIRLMSDRAEKSKLPSWCQTSPPGTSFLGSEDFPPALLDVAKKWDPACYMLEQYTDGDDESGLQERFNAKVRSLLSGKRILIQSGEVDKLVPYECGEQFYKSLHAAAENEKDISVENIVYRDVGHAVSPEMADKAVEWICNTLETPSRHHTTLSEESKI
jgi:pimeloyl-ACP methyl ester carboxylesterase